MRKLNSAMERFALQHPNFGVPNLMLYIVIGNVIAFFLLRMRSEEHTLNSSHQF